MNQHNLSDRRNLVGPWAGLPVAWTDDDEFDEATYRDDVARCCRSGMPGIYTGGTTGEFYAQEIDEFERIARATIETCRQFNTPSMIGCTATSTRGAVRRAKLAADLGADAIQVALPFWMEVRDADVVPFFRAVAEAAGLPLSIYETTRAGKCLAVDQHRRIHAEVPRYVMVKANASTVGNTVAGCRELSALVSVFVGENRWFELGPHGAAGCCSSLVYWHPPTMLSAWQSLRAGDWPALQAHCEGVSALFDGMARAWAGRGLTDSAYDRIGALSNGVLRTSLRMRGPYPSPEPADVATMRRLYEQHYPAMLAPCGADLTRAIS
jgi:4-hydroxy-tetrahydrodipicolinate synthase